MISILPVFCFKESISNIDSFVIIHLQRYVFLPKYQLFFKYICIKGKLFLDYLQTSETFVTLFRISGRE